MSASTVEIKELTKSNCSSSSSKRTESLYTAPRFSLKPRMLHRKNDARQGGFISAGINDGLSSDIRQRVLSARQHRSKNLQNQLNMALQQNAELVSENRLLKTLHKRQDNALAKYEGSSGELPQLIKSHSEELRVWQTKYRLLNLQNREVNKKVQQKDKIINDLNDRLKYLTALTTEKNLEERDVLKEKIESLEAKLTEKEEEVKMLARRNVIEAKNFKTQLINEKKKYKESCQKQNTEKQSIDSDHSSAKDVREIKNTKAHSNRPSITISEETPPMDLNIELEDDDDLVIKQYMDKNSRNGDHLAQQLADIHLFTTEEAQNIHAIQKKIQNDIEKNEAYLDLHCEQQCNEINRDIVGLNLPNGLFSGDESNELRSSKPVNEMLLFKSDKQNLMHEPFSSERGKAAKVSNLPRFNINMGGKPLKRAPIDPQRKIKLLAQLKSIESGNGCL